MAFQTLLCQRRAKERDTRPQDRASCSRLLPDSWLRGPPRARERASSQSHTAEPVLSGRVSRLNAETGVGDLGDLTTSMLLPPAGVQEAATEVEDTLVSSQRRDQPLHVPGRPRRHPGCLRLRDGVAGRACRWDTSQNTSSGTRKASLKTLMSSCEVKTAQMNWKMFYLYFSHILEPLFPWFKSLHCLIADFHL